MKQVKVVQNPEKEIPAEVLAESIVAISQGIRRLRAGRLNDRALVLLIQYASPPVGRSQRIGQTEVRAVLEGIESLERTYIRKPVKP